MLANYEHDPCMGNLSFSSLENSRQLLQLSWKNRMDKIIQFNNKHSDRTSEYWVVHSVDKTNAERPFYETYIAPWSPT